MLFHVILAKFLTHSMEITVMCVYSVEITKILSHWKNFRESNG